jgi:site-specific recombinase XerD
MKTETIEQFLYRRYTKQSAKTYNFVINGFLLANPRAESFEYKDIVNHFVQLKPRYPNISTRNGILSAIKTYYDYLIEQGIRQNHPCKTFRIKGENISKRRQMQFQDLFLPSELEQLLKRENRFDNLKLRNKITISLLIYQGLVCDEIIRIDLENIDLDSSTIYIKGSSKLNSRTLKLEMIQKEWIEEYVKTYRKKLMRVVTNRLLIGHRGDPETVEGIGGMLNPLRALFPERVLNAKTIRSSVISNWFNVYKLRVEEVQIMAGHRWPSSTLRYKRTDIAEQRVKINMWHPLK